MELQKDGIAIFEDYLSENDRSSINKELDKLFSPAHLSLNGYLGHVFGTTKLKSIALPTASIKSLNLLEHAIDIANLIQAADPIDEQRVLTALEIWEEVNQHIPLFWHTDNREGMIRAFIYIEGGKVDSGAFKYMKGTHKRRNEILGQKAEDSQDNSEFFHNKLTEKQVQSEADNIVVADNGPRSMAIAYTEGFHGNFPRIKRRRVIMFEFQPLSKFNYPRSEIYIPSSLLSRKVQQNLQLFANQAENSPQYYGTDAYLSKPPSTSKKVISSGVEYLFFTSKKLAGLLNLFKK